MTHYYYHLTSAGEDTNLQLYSLRQAQKYWTELKTDYDEHGEDTKDLKERSVFVLATLGLSISQLLGQNIVNPKNKKVDSPEPLFKEFVDNHELDPELKTEFKNFNYFYNGCRHFGLTTSGEGHQKVNELTYSKTKDCFEFGMKVWKTVIQVYEKDNDDWDESVYEELGIDA